VSRVLLIAGLLAATGCAAGAAVAQQPRDPMLGGASAVAVPGLAGGPALAGESVAFARRDDRVVVTDLSTGRVAYRAKVRYADHFSLGADGTLARTLFPERCCSLVGRLGWHAPESPRLHRLPNRVAVFSGPPLVYAAGRIAYVSRDDDGGATLSVTDLSGRSRDHASFQAPEQLESFAFDGARLTFAHTRFRPDRSRAAERPECPYRD
jgi:hypothetical protein